MNEGKMLNIRTVTIIGVTGTMGANVAGIFALLGDAKVYCIGRDIEKVKLTIPRIVHAVKTDMVEKNLIPADMSMLKQCVAESDLVFESTKEDLQVKREIAVQVGEELQPHAVSGTGSSGLSITEIAKCYPEGIRGHFFGIHLFNPPYTLPLCELTSTPYTDAKVRLELKEYLQKKIKRTVVDVKDSPAFLANRIGFQFINEALQYADKYQDKGGIDYIDALLGPFTGRIMAPLATSDFVGLDVHQAIVDNIYKNTYDYAHETFILPMFARKLIAEGKLGRKSRGGLYQLVREESGLKRQKVYDIHTGFYRDVILYDLPFADEMKRCFLEGNYRRAFERLVSHRSKEAEICLSFLLKYIIYSIYAAAEVGDTIDAADDVMAAGFHWCPPLALYQALSMVTDVPALIKERLPDICRKTNVDYFLATIEPSKYDYHTFFQTEHIK